MATTRPTWVLLVLATLVFPVLGTSTGTLQELASATEDAVVATDGHAGVLPALEASSSGFLVELASAPLVHGTDPDALAQEQTAALEAIAAVVPDAAMRWNYVHVFNGFHLDIEAKDAMALRDAGFRVWPDVRLQATLADTVPLIRATNAWDEQTPATEFTPATYANQGHGIRIAILDTGVDYTHSDLGGCAPLDCWELPDLTPGPLCQGTCPIIHEPLGPLTPEDPCADIELVDCGASVRETLESTACLAEASCDALTGPVGPLAPASPCLLLDNALAGPSLCERDMHDIINNACLQPVCDALYDAREPMPEDPPCDLLTTSPAYCDTSAQMLYEMAPCIDCPALDLYENMCHRLAKLAQCPASSSPVGLVHDAACAPPPAKGSTSQGPCTRTVRDAWGMTRNIVCLNALACQAGPAPMDAACDTVHPACTTTAGDAWDALATTLCILPAMCAPEPPVMDQVCERLRSCSLSPQGAWQSIRSATCALPASCSSAPAPAAVLAEACGIEPCDRIADGDPSFVCEGDVHCHTAEHMVCYGAPECKVVGGWDFVNNDPDPMDDHYHGTHVAAIAAGNGTLMGVAPAAKILAFKVLSAQGYGFSSDIIAAIEASLDPDGDGNTSDKAHVINLSLGGPGDPDDPLSRAVDNAVAGGTVVAVAAGNSGAPRTILSPATARDAITVAASTKQDRTAYFSSRGPVPWCDAQGECHVLGKPDVIAPGWAVCAAMSRTLYQKYGSGGCEERHLSLSGTSMAAPHVAGVAALVREAHPTWDPHQVKSAVKATAVPIDDPGLWAYTGYVQDMGSQVIAHGAGRVDAADAVAAVSAPVAQLSEIVADWPNEINGTVRGAATWELSYVRFAEARNATWTHLANGTGDRTGRLADVAPMRTTLPDGNIVLRLTAADGSGSTAVDHAILPVDKTTIVTPMQGDIFGATKIDVRVETQTPAAGFEVDVGAVEGYYDAPADWTRVTESASPDLSWDASGWDRGFYRLRVSTSYNGTSLVDLEEVLVYVDDKMASGWPQRLPHEVAEPGVSYWYPGRQQPVVEDLDGDGDNEIVVSVLGHPSRLRVFASDGTLQWQYRGNFSANLHAPLIVDLDGDGNKSIVLHEETWVEDGRRVVFISLGPQGAVETWNATLHGRFWHAVAGDVDEDGLAEIVVLAVDEQDPDVPRRTFTILGADGAEHAWSIQAPGYIYQGSGGFGWAATDVRNLVLGQFDDDAALEFVTSEPLHEPEGSSRIHVYNGNGTHVSGWPKVVGGYLPYHPGVGDLDGDGLDDVATTTASDPDRVYEWDAIEAWSSDGTPLPGWPRTISTADGGYYSSPAAIGDVDDDGKGEVFAARRGTSTYHHEPPFYKHSIYPRLWAYDAGGEAMPGWPQDLCHNVWQKAPRFLDTNGSGAREIVLTLGSHACLYHPVLSLPGGAGFHIWSANGTAAGLPHATDIDALAEPLLADVDGDGDAEIVASSFLNIEPGSLRGDELEGSRLKGRGEVYVWDMT